ncbi:MAG TPA: MucR family transcriptional regulator [Rhodopila sp.]|jgi:predicted transcriptional regulator|nr:MucR family transcriptional regulator [Rhodopila sp.]
MSDQNRHLLALSAQIVAAHSSHNPVGIDALPTIIRQVYNTLVDLDPHAAHTPHAAAPALSRHDHAAHNHAGHDHSAHIPRGAHNAHVHPVYGPTVFGDRLICMEDGLTMKMLKRHLLTVHGMTPEEYRAKWNLPADYPMVAADYAKLRSSLAVQSGLGLKPEDRPGKKRKSRRG